MTTIEFPEISDATACDAPANTSPHVGAMGVGQPADADPVAEQPRRSTLALCREAMDMLGPDGDASYWSDAHTNALREAVDVFAASAL